MPPLMEEAVVTESGKGNRAKIVGLLRVKNEQRWLGRCLRSLAFCEQVIILDDHSTDQTREVAIREVPDRVHLRYIRSMFDGLNESRDRNYLLSQAAAFAPDWVVMPDGDEEFTASAQESLLHWVQVAPRSCPMEFVSLNFRMLYLWNDERTVRVDRVYGQFRALRAWQYRPELAFSGGRPGSGFHCGHLLSSQNGVRRKGFVVDAPMVHYGYLDPQERRRKYDFYTSRDPGNQSEDGYRHLIQGDPGGAPAEERLGVAGPLRLASLEAACS